MFTDGLHSSFEKRREKKKPNASWEEKDDRKDEMA